MSTRLSKIITKIVHFTYPGVEAPGTPKKNIFLFLANFSQIDFSIRISFKLSNCPQYCPQNCSRNFVQNCPWNYPKKCPPNYLIPKLSVQNCAQLVHEIVPENFGQIDFSIRISFKLSQKLWPKLFENCPGDWSRICPRILFKVWILSEDISWSLPISFLKIRFSCNQNIGETLLHWVSPKFWLQENLIFRKKLGNWSEVHS